MRVGVSGPSCASSAEGKFWCWGQCLDGLCGYGDEEVGTLRAGNRLPDASAVPPMQFTPDPDEGHVIQVVGLTSEIEANAAQCLLTSTGSVRCWGAGAYLPYANGSDILSPNDAPRTFGYGPSTSRAQNMAGGAAHHSVKAVQLYAGVNQFCVVLEDRVQLDSYIYSGSNVECWGAIAMFGHSGLIAGWGNPTHSLGGEIANIRYGALVGQGPQQLAIGTNGACAIHTNNAVFCFGARENSPATWAAWY